MSSKWGTLQEKLIRIVLENKEKPKGEKKTNKELFREFAENNNTTESSTSFQYYNHIKPKLEDKISDGSEDMILSEVSLNENKKRVGETVDVTVRTIVDFGVFVTTDDGAEGLIHISQITGREFVAIPDDYFFEGEITKAKILKIEPTGKLSLSTRAIGGKEKVDSRFSGLGEIAPSQDTSTKYSYEKQDKVEVSEKRFNVLKPKISDSEKDHVIQFVKNYSDNNISTKSLKEIESLLAQHSVFKITLALVEAVRDLDISSFIIELTKDRLSGEHLRRNERENFSHQALSRKVD